MNINEIMSLNVKTCEAQSSLDDVARLMWEHDCGAIPVVDDENKPIGIVTDRDIAMAAMLKHKPLWSMTPEEFIYGQKLSCCQQNDSLQDCLNKMKSNGVRRIMVTNADGTLAGIVSIGDIVAFTGNSHMNTASPLHALNIEPVVAMLKEVSGHHSQLERPMTEVKSN